MGPSVTSCSTTTYGFGDNTAGPIWRATRPEGQGILGSFTKTTNAPFGDNLFSPVGVSYIIQPVMFKATMAVAGPVCGYNIVNMLGFFLSALTMFGFIYVLTRKKWIALFAGYATSFTPYYQVKIGGHPSYGYQAIFIGLIWLFYNLMKYKRKRDAIYLGILFAIACYFDPYFSLLSATVLGALTLTWLVVNKSGIIGFFKTRDKNKTYQIDIRKQAKLLLISALSFILLLSPLIFVLSTQGKQINSNVAAARGNVLLETKACSNWPHEYLVPFVLNPVFEKIFVKEHYAAVVNNLKANFLVGLVRIL
jgi:hypothetical protein